ncbi:YbgA family protein [Geomonas subterranea]|uniref:DUF523 and DUF1722 domain-containing protein n=1 Tax=Geomonas subterranea TaxID=2847989 RepID=A0ABX8LAL8_9BACT|nr:MULTISPECIES: DUF523 and DUF1722 domain-containing protein [Geomonas]QXE89016.1 DUF523 and DUF1722 domain-containing protein [Geomonas subterranea]QXM08865.1 DUF523 and DUF1722 domain-containing protein [Geomonas subterranea]
MSGSGASIKIGVSSCLLGEKVRYDGGHKHDPYLTGVLGRFFSFVPVCPEVECGMGTPREAMRLEGDPEKPRLMTHRTRIDKTGQMLEFCRNKVEQLAHEELCGFVFKKGSPSSGLFRVKVYREGMPPVAGRGLFAAAVARRFPQLPMEEEGRLNDPVLRENFIERVFAFRRWKDFLADEPDLGKLVQFHTCQKLLVMSHSTQLYRELGALVARGKELPFPQLLERYQELYMKALELHATVKKQTNVLMHIMGYFKKNLCTEEKQELSQLIAQYHDGVVPLVVPLTMLKHYVAKYRQEYLRQQVYLSPHPAELMLRNHV